MRITCESIGTQILDHKHVIYFDTLRRQLLQFYVSHDLAICQFYKYKRDQYLPKVIIGIIKYQYISISATPRSRLHCDLE
jgi:hypothetical protein